MRQWQTISRLIPNWYERRNRYFMIYTRQIQVGRIYYCIMHGYPSNRTQPTRVLKSDSDTLVTCSIPRPSILGLLVKHVKYYHGGRIIHFIPSIFKIQSQMWYHSVSVQYRSVYQAPSYEPNLTSLVWFLPEIAYLIMLSILEVVCTACSADHLKNKQHAQISQLQQMVREI